MICRNSWQNFTVVGAWIKKSPLELSYRSIQHDDSAKGLMAGLAGSCGSYGV